METTLNATLFEESPSLVLASATLLDTGVEEKYQRPHRMINIMVSYEKTIVFSNLAVVVAVKLVEKHGPNKISDSSSWLSSIFFCDWGGLSCSEDDSRIISLEGSIPAEIDHL